MNPFGKKELTRLIRKERSDRSKIEMTFDAVGRKAWPRDLIAFDAMNAKYSEESSEYREKSLTELYPIFEKRFQLRNLRRLSVRLRTRGMDTRFDLSCVWNSPSMTKWEDVDGIGGIGQLAQIDMFRDMGFGLRRYGNNSTDWHLLYGNSPIESDHQFMRDMFGPTGTTLFEPRSDDTPLTDLQWMRARIIEATEQVKAKNPI